MSSSAQVPYRGRLAPSPTGLLHLGHARTFWVAAERARRRGGLLLLRNDDLDRSRCKPAFVDAMREDLHWLGLSWEEPMVNQSDRIPRYREALRQLHREGLLFPCTRSRKDVAEAVGAPHEGGDADEPVYPLEWRPTATEPVPALEFPARVNWRFRVPLGETVTFTDRALGPQQATAGTDFGDFLVWRKDDVPSYQLACAVDDADMGITEVVRGADLVKSTFRQLLLLRSLGQPSPQFLHCPLVADATGQRLAKRHDALSLRALRDEGTDPAALCGRFADELASLISP
ncbi:tRNA glutamyl-Q(34) synthetase GluQRS [Nibricoccus sp. IMCC34717]|uniref:tRNA glutamyl-Q(34) synthetase GluQRS n=1 Tax=Nibricoccus sp. IMCC34717 TaxID=3034021 RepID=UPI00384EF779